MPLIDDQQCFQTVRELRWPEGIVCPRCDSTRVTKEGFDGTQTGRQRYVCGGCKRKFDDLTGTIFAGHHQPLRVWSLWLYFMGLNLSNSQIARELDPDSAHELATQLRQGIQAKQSVVVLLDEVECNEVYVVAGHQGYPEAVKKRLAGPSASAERGSWTEHSGERKTADTGNDSTDG